MSVIKTYNIDTVEKVKNIREKVIAKQEDAKYDEYTPNDIMLVRTTNVFPQNRTIHSLSNQVVLDECAFNFLNSTFQYQYDESVINEMNYSVPYYRSTIHFTENGLVSSHSYGNFDYQNFIILDPLNKHIGKEMFKNFAGHDTFVTNTFELSDEAIIVINEAKYEDLKEKNPELEKYNIVLYNGIPENLKKEYIANHPDGLPEFDVNDERAVIEMILMDLGYTPELIGAHYVINSATSSKLSSVNKKLAQQYGAQYDEKHHNTQDYKDDYEKRSYIENQFDQLLLNFIVQKRNINEEYLDIGSKPNRESAYNLEGLIGIEAMLEDVKEFDYTIHFMKENGLMITPQDFIDGKTLDIYACYNEIKLGNGIKK